MRRFRFIAALCGAVSVAWHTPAHAQSNMNMSSVGLGGGWQLDYMGQGYPIVTVGAPGESGSPLRETGWYFTQPALMSHLYGPGRRLVLHTTLNFEGMTQESGELTFGGWGEGFIDKRHPHTLLHEIMLSANFWQVAGGAASISAGKGLAPYGTPDPMSRPGLKYPTNHHLSQIPERWIVSGAYQRAGWSVEAGIFGGHEPEGVYDFSNVESFGDSWSARIARSWSTAAATRWDVSLSAASVTEDAHTVSETTRLGNVGVERHGPLSGGQLHVLAEASRSFLSGHEDFFSVLGEARWTLRGHMPYARVEYASRPEYAREGVAGVNEFFRYDHDSDPIGATRWVINTAGYEFELKRGPLIARPVVEVQHHQARGDSGGIASTDLYGTTRFWALSAGARIYFGGGPMRMGSYGVRDPMDAMGPSMPMNADGHVH